MIIMKDKQKIRFGLCCQFLEQHIKFKIITFKSFSALTEKEQDEKLDSLILHNVSTLLAALKFCIVNQIFAFRITSTLFPLYTHPKCNYTLEALPSGKKILELLHQCKKFASESNLRLSFHPDQFVVLNSPRDDVVENSIEDLKYHSYLSELLGADVINIHGGGVYGDKHEALKRLRNTISHLPKEILNRLTLENDDKSYTPLDLLPTCEEFGVPLVYDVHHHRCLKDKLTEVEASQKAYATWNREPLFHLSSPKDGWSGPKPSRHHDFIDPADFPLFWKEMLPLTVDIEAKAKEVAVQRIMREVYL